MHFFFILRGIKHDFDRFCQELECLKWPMPMKDNLSGQVKMNLVQGALRPIQLFEYVFPKESFEEVWRTMGIGAPEDKYYYLNKYAFLLRKVLGAKRIPDKINLEGAKQFIYNRNLQIYPIGIKEDNDASITYEAL